MNIPEYDYDYMPHPDYLPHPEYMPHVPEVHHEIEIMTVTETLAAHTVTLPPPANTRLAAYPKPEGHMLTSSATTHSPRTTVVEHFVEQPTPTVAFQERRAPPAKWFGGW